MSDVASLQQEENVSISGSNARLLIMKKLSRKTKVREGGRGEEGERREEEEKGGVRKRREANGEGTRDCNSFFSPGLGL